MIKTGEVRQETIISDKQDIAIERWSADKDYALGVNKASVLKIQCRVVLTYEHHVFLRVTCEREGSVVGGGFSCASWDRLSLKPAIDLRRLAARAREARSESCPCSGGEAACEHVFMCACAIATWSSLEERLRRPRASHVAQRPSSMDPRAFGPATPRTLSAYCSQRTWWRLNWCHPTSDARASVLVRHTRISRRSSGWRRIRSIDRRNRFNAIMGTR